MALNTSPTPELPGRWVVTKFGGPSVLDWQTWQPDDESLFNLPPDQVLVRIITAGIAGPDNIQRAGGYPHPKSSKPGFTPGYDFVGEIVSVGSDVSSKAPSLIPGQRVASMCIFGAHATHIVLPYTDLLAINQEDDLLKVCALPLNYMTAFGMLKRSGVDLKPGGSILIGSAAGGLGTAIAQLVQAFKMDLKMIGTCSPAKFEYVKSLGVIPLDRNEPNLVEKILEATDGKGVDVAYDAVGSKTSIQNGYGALRKDGAGKLIVVGIMDAIDKDGNGMRENVNPLSFELLPGMSIFLVTRDYYDLTRKTFDEDFNAILTKVRTGELDPVISKLYRLDQAIEVHQELISGSNVRGKMLFIVDKALAVEKGL